DFDSSAEGAEAGGYTVWYGESVENRWVSKIPFVDVAPVNFTASGVIVSNPSKGIWFEKIPKGALEVNSKMTFYVGELLWEREVTVRRRGMTTPTGNKTYSVTVRITRNELVRRHVALRLRPRLRLQLPAGRHVHRRPRLEHLAPSDGERPSRGTRKVERDETCLSQEERDRDGGRPFQDRRRTRLRTFEGEEHDGGSRKNDVVA
ncbi:MAG: hypothetical protein SV760_01700, partial [Halobacteria archaeon]|nr:hypothetical protein [Halobacteria archaeon]